MRRLPRSVSLFSPFPPPLVPILLSLLLHPALSAQATFTVNTTDDVDDGVCDVAHCSLREALNAAALEAGGVTVAFNIPGPAPHTIRPTSVLPLLQDQTLVDGTTEPDFAGKPVIELDGTNAGGFAQGLIVAGSGNTIRGLVVNRFSDVGISIGSGAEGNRVEGCYVGTDVSGSEARGNGNIGILIGQASGNTIGGTTAAARNVISGNREGITLWDAGATENDVQGNYIGTNAAGDAAIPNDFGVMVYAPDNLIGGVEAGAGNLISGNGVNGVNIYGENATGNTLQGNRIGPDAAGTAALGNGESGVAIYSADDNIVGGTASGARNLLSGNVFGVLVASDDADGNIIQGNFIGVDVSGALALPNSQTGILLWGQNTVIGGTEAGAGNVISGNVFAGIDLGGGSSGTVIQGNYIGTDAAGTAALGNDLGIFVNFSADNTIGGTQSGARNLISGNTSGSVTINGADATGNVLQGNYVGTDVTGGLEMGNGRGIQILGAPGNTIGGAAAGAGNLISANLNGLLLIGAGASQNLIQGNRFGTDVTGAVAMGNRGATIRISEGASNNTIGGSISQAGNVVANAGWMGVILFSDAGTGNLIRSNSIFDNAALGIELGRDGVSENDEGDADTGANNLQNYPVLTSVASGNGAVVQAALNSAPNATYTVEFFSNAECDATGFGEGKTPLGTAALTTDALGNGTVSTSFSSITGSVLTATATDAAGNTSEFSQCGTLSTLTVSPSPSTRTVMAGQSAVYTLSVTAEGGTFDETVSLGCSGNPSGTTCTFDPSQVTLAEGQASAVMTVNTVAPAAVPPLRPDSGPSPSWWILLAALLVVVAALEPVRAGAWSSPGSVPHRGRRLGWVWGAALLILFPLAATSCGDGGTDPPSGGTPPGSYTLTVTATWQSATVSTTATMVVQ